jgi:hypothetical protein
VVAPIFSVSMVLLTFARFEITPALRDYPITAAHVVLAVLLALAVGLLTGAPGLRMTRGFEPSAIEQPEP